MGHRLVVENFKKIKKAIPLIESKIKIKISYNKGSVSIIGNELNEYLVEKVLQAVDFGFEGEDALLLLNEDFILEFVNVKDHTRRKNLTDIRARLIGTGGKAKRTIEDLTGGVIVLNANTVGIIVDNEHLSQAIQGIISLIQGSKHGNVFSYLEKQNANLNKKNFDSDDLGLRDGMFKKNK
jgi:ribosomal RNA assembly protein